MISVVAPRVSNLSVATSGVTLRPVPLSKTPTFMRDAPALWRAMACKLITAVQPASMAFCAFSGEPPAWEEYPWNTASSFVVAKKP